MHKAILKKLWGEVRGSQCRDSSLMDTLKVHLVPAFRCAILFTAPLLSYNRCQNVALLPLKSARKADVPLEALLLESADAGYMACVKAFVDAGADLWVTDSFGLTPLVGGCTHRSLQISSYLMTPPHETSGAW